MVDQTLQSEFPTLNELHAALPAHQPATQAGGPAITVSSATPSPSPSHSNDDNLYTGGSSTDNHAFSGPTHEDFSNDDNSYASAANPGELDDGDDNDDRSLFVGDIAKVLTEEQIHALFSAFGEVLAVEIKRDRITKASLGYAFVQFKDRNAAANAKKKLHRTVVEGRAIRIGWAQKNTNLFVGDLDQSVTSEMLREAFRAFGEIIDDETFAKKQNYGFVKFKRRSDAESAKREMDGKLLGGRRIRTGWGDTNTQRHCVHIQFDTSASSAPVLTEDDLFVAFSPHGKVQNVHLPRTAGKLRGFGFVRYSDDDDGEESAEAAISALHNTRVGSVTISCNFGKKQHTRRSITSLPSSLPSLSVPQPSSSHTHDPYNSTPKSPKDSSIQQISRENTHLTSTNNGDAYDMYQGADGINDNSQHNTFKSDIPDSSNHQHSGKAKGRFRQQYKQNSFPPQQRQINGNHSHRTSSMHPLQTPTLPHNPTNLLPHTLPSTQVVPSMYPGWMHQGWMPFMMPQYYSSVMPMNENTEQSFNDVNPHFQAVPGLPSAEELQHVYMYSYSNPHSYSSSNSPYSPPNSSYSPSNSHSYSSSSAHSYPPVHAPPYPGYSYAYSAPGT